MSATLTRRMSVTNGRCGVIHAAQDQRTLCGRDATMMLTLSGMGPWEAIGWEAAAQGPCQRCSAKLAKMPRVAPIAIDSTPAGIFAAMMRANASESAAPQSRLYGLLSDYLRRTLAATYGAVAAEHIYQTALSSGEFNSETIPYGLESVQYGATELVEMADLRTGDTVSTDVGPVLLVKDSAPRGLLGVRSFTGRILSVESVAPECVWILRNNVVTGHAVDYWVTQGAPRRLFSRYV
jgi:hypothetical protein